MKSLEVIYDTNASGGCGCNCGCGGSTVVEDMKELIDELNEYEFKKEIKVNPITVDELEKEVLIEKINSLLDNTNAAFRVNTENLDDALSNILPLVALDGTILTAYGVPTFYDVILEVDKKL